jgi:DnaJ-class molecular chaperone
VSETTNGETCQTCQGTGIVDVQEAMHCAACDGTGKIMESDCICCLGVGQQQVTINAICPDCDGLES